MPFWSQGVLRVRFCLPVAGLLAMHAYGADRGAGAPAHPPLGDAVEQVCKHDSLNACDALIGFAVKAGLAQGERTRIAQQRLDAAATQLQPKEDEVPGNSTSKARRWITQAIRLDRSVSKPTVSLGRVASTRLGALQQKQLQELAQEEAEAQRHEADQRAYWPERAISAVVELPSAMKTPPQGLLADAVLEQAARFLEPLEADGSLSTPERIRVALHLGILKMKRKEEDGARAELRKALEMDHQAVLPYDAPDDTPENVSHLLEELRKGFEPPPLPPPLHCPGDLRCLPPPPPPVADYWRTVGFVSGVAGIAAIGGGIGFGVLTYQSHEAERNASVSGNYSDYLAKKQDAVLQSHISTGFYVAGTIGLACGTYLVFLRSPPAGARSASILVAPGRSKLVFSGAF